MRLEKEITKKGIEDCKSNLFEIVSNLASSFGSPARLKILQILSQAPRSVHAISEITGESVANTSQHLQRLLREHLVWVKKEKLTRVYSLRDNRIALLIENLFDVAESVSQEFVEVEKMIKEDDLQFPEALEGALHAVESKKALFIDVRESCEAQHSYVEGAISLPYESLKEEAKKLSKSKTYFIFCRGRTCELAGNGVRILRSMGFKAFRIQESAVLINKKGKMYE